MNTCRYHYNPNDRLRMADVRRWAFYNIGASMCARDTGMVHGPGRPAAVDVFAELHCDDCGHVETIPSHDDRPPRCENCGSSAVERRSFGTAPVL